MVAAVVYACGRSITSFGSAYSRSSLGLGCICPSDGGSVAFVRIHPIITMLLGISIFAVCLFAVSGIIAVHECGHYLAGLAGGIPHHSMRVRLLVFPQHVALRDNDRWLHPNFDYERYAMVAMAFLGDRPRAVLYVAGGLIMQTIAFVVLVLGGGAAGVPRFWLLPVAVAMTSVLVLYLCGDLIFTRLANKPCGDFSFLWKISPASSVAVTIGILAAHAAALIRLF